MSIEPVPDWSDPGFRESRGGGIPTPPLRRRARSLYPIGQGAGTQLTAQDQSFATPLQRNAVAAHVQSETSVVRLLAQLDELRVGWPVPGDDADRRHGIVARQAHGRLD